jgi:hypothetical protein
MLFLEKSNNIPCRVSKSTLVFEHNGFLPPHSHLSSQRCRGEREGKPCAEKRMQKICWEKGEMILENKYGKIHIMTEREIGDDKR